MRGMLVRLPVLAASLWTGAAQAITAPTEESIPAMAAKCAEYVSYGWAPEQITSRLHGWFGWTFEPYEDRSAGVVDYRIVLRTIDTSQIYYLRTVCSAPAR